MSTGKRSYGNLSLEKLFTILDSFSLETPELSFQELMDITGMHKSTLHRFLITLEDNNYLDRSRLTGKYRPGLKFFELGTIVSRNMDLRKVAYPLLEELSKKLGCTVHMVVRDGLQAMYVDKFSPPQALVQYSQLGKRLPLNCTAVGKVLVAYLSPDHCKQVVERMKMEKRTNNSIVCKEEFLKHLELVTQRGYAIDDEELVEGLMCVAMPVLGQNGQIEAAVSISGMPSRIRSLLEPESGAITALREATMSMSFQLGYIEARSARSSRSPENF